MGLLPYQQLIRDASPNEQRVFRELQEGLLEAERIRAQTGRWPDVAALEAEGIPPFARDPTQKIAYTWTSVRQDWATNYLGVPSDPSQPAWVLVILEPEPGAPRRSGAERRNASPAARRDDAARVDLEYAGRKAPQRLRRAEAAAERWMDELAGGVKCAITIAVSTQRHERHERTPHEKMYFSAGCVSGLCGDASSSPAAKRPAARETQTQIQDLQVATVLYSRLRFLARRLRRELDASPVPLC